MCKKKIFIYLFICLFTVIDSFGQSQQKSNSLKVLFIGNSYTYFNNLPQMLEKIAQSNGQELTAKMIVEGGATLQDLWEKENTLKVIKQEKWDYIVLQEQSVLGNVHIINGEEKIVDPTNFHKYARLFDKEIKNSGAKTIFYLTWARENAESREQKALNSAYMSIARELNAGIAPVGIVWQQVRLKKPDLKLYIEDKSHPTPIGSYLAANVIYQSLYGKNPENLVQKITGNPVEDDGKVDVAQTAELVTVSKRDAKIIQDIARVNYEKLKAAGGYLILPKPSIPKVPTVGKGRKPTNKELEGVWVGTLKFYPVSWKATMRLTIRQEKDELKADLKISFEGQPNAEKNPSVTNFKLIENGIIFTDSQGIGGTPIKYEAAFQGKSLSGITEFKSKDNSMFAIGTFDLKPEK